MRVRWFLCPIRYLFSGPSYEVLRNSYMFIIFISNFNLLINKRRWGQGSTIWILRRSKINTEILQIIYFYQNSWHLRMGLLVNTKTCVILMTLFIVNTNGIENIDEVKKQKIDYFINSLLFSCDRNHFAGANLALVYQGEVVYTTGYGVRHLRKKNINFYYYRPHT